jgi:hypothetical protein
VFGHFDASSLQNAVEGGIGLDLFHHSPPKTDRSVIFVKINEI